MQLNRKEVAALQLALRAARDLSPLSCDGFTLEVRRVIEQAQAALQAARTTHRHLLLAEASAPHGDA